MRIKNQKQLSIETLKKQLEKTLPQYHYEIHKKTVTAIKDEKAKTAQAYEEIVAKNEAEILQLQQEKLNRV